MKSEDVVTACNAAHKFAALHAAHDVLGEFGSVFVRRCYDFDARLCIFDIPPGCYEPILLLHFFNSEGPLLPPENTRHAYCVRGRGSLTPPATVQHHENILGVPSNDEWGRVRRPHRPFGLRLDVRTPDKTFHAYGAGDSRARELAMAASQTNWCQQGEGYNVRFEHVFELNWPNFEWAVGRGWQLFPGREKMIVDDKERSRVFRLHKIGYEAFGGVRFGGMLLRQVRYH
ncbi:hypothetical protein CBOM_01038 [Ceraceosorus bombacis]|uniref:Uncharacterized protein n=1 Tax=Ceraceosorus bombacis TaxID=401625 RepID=A0A0P1BBI1_9BASI|nr:hypothetical protein CBOM_01038 [Ceraceosorus bombacis]